VFILAGRRIGAGKESEKRLGGFGARRRGGKCQRFGGKGSVILIEERQVDQPFARIIDDIQMQLRKTDDALQQRSLLIFYCDAEFGNAAGAFRPCRRRGQKIPKMILIIEARHAIVGLRLEVSADDPMLGVGGKKRQTASRDKVTDKGGYENRLTGTRQSGDAETYGRRQVVADARLRILDEIGISEVSQGMPRVSFAMKKGTKSPL